MFTSWILNLFRVTGYPNPELGVRVLGQNGGVLYSATLGILIPVNVNAPEWRQIGSVINSQDNTSLTVEFLSEGPEVIGNDYAIDDVSFQEIQEPLFIPVKTVDRPAANVGETVRYTVTLTNTCESPLTGVFFRDSVPNGLVFVPGSVTVNGAPDTAADPDIGFALPDVPGGGTVTVAFSAAVTEVPTPNPTLNSASVRYEYTPVEGGIPGEFNVVSNYVPVEVGESADLSVVKTSSPSPVDPGSLLTYTVTISNAGPSPAENVQLADNVSSTLADAELSTDGGATWSPWAGPYPLDRLISGESRTILIRGTVDFSANGRIENTATVLSSTPDPDLSNNSDTVVTPVNELADLSVVKLGSPKPAVPGRAAHLHGDRLQRGPLRRDRRAADGHHTRRADRCGVFRRQRRLLPALDRVPCFGRPRAEHRAPGADPRAGEPLGGGDHRQYRRGGQRDPRSRSRQQHLN